LIFSIIENFIFFSTIFAAGGFLSAFILKVADDVNWLKISPFLLARLFAVAVFLPPVLALWLVLAALLPQLWLGTDLFNTIHPAPHHEFHLFGDITESFEPYLSIATVALIFTIIAAAIMKSVRGYRRLGSVLESLEIPTAAPTTKQLEIIEDISDRYYLKTGLITSRRPFTFVWGFWRTKLIVSSGLLESLTDEELRGVVEHEAAHHTRRDNSFKSILLAVSYFSLAFPLTRQIIKWQAEQIELVCDEIAASKTKAPLEIASALVKLSRKTDSAFAEMSLATAFFTKGEKTIEKRVKRLIYLEDAPHSTSSIHYLEKPPKLEFGGTVFAFSATLIAVLTLAPLAVHRAAEFLFQTIK
jgi:Zn-dependent protease with chaperone function